MELWSVPGCCDASASDSRQRSDRFPRSGVQNPRIRPLRPVKGKGRLAEHLVATEAEVLDTQGQHLPGTFESPAASGLAKMFNCTTQSCIKSLVELFGGD